MDRAGRARERFDAAKTAALVALAEHGCTTDIQEVLVCGSPAGFTRPGALDKMVRAVEAALSPPEDQAGWRDIADAPKDGMAVLALVTTDKERLGPRWWNLAGRIFQIRHEGQTPSNYDLGWAVYPGLGGAPTEWFTHYMPLPAPPPPQDR